MGLCQEAVGLALKLKMDQKAMEYAKNEDTEKKKLWIQIATNMLQEQKDNFVNVKRLMEESNDQIKIEDLLPLFNENVKIQDFRVRG